VQNSPKELMALLCFLMPLFSRSKTSEYDEGGSNDGGESMLRHFVSLESKDGRDTSDEAAYRKLKQLFAPFVLRRRKVDVLHQIIPPKIRKLELVPLDDTTKAVYDSLLASHLQQKQESSTCSDTYSVKQHLFTDLRKAANHPLLLRRRHTSEEDITHMAKYFYMFGYFGGDATCSDKHVRAELEKFSDLDIHLVSHQLIDENPTREKLLSRFLLSENDLFASPKFARLAQLVPDLVKNGHRVLIFSQWTKCLDLLGCLVDTLGLKFLRLDGDTCVADRQGLIDTFNNDSSYSVFLLSTRAGGMGESSVLALMFDFFQPCSYKLFLPRLWVGINLTAADTCILHDLDFNPFNDEQAESRCHRIGQKKPVTVYKVRTVATTVGSGFLVES
jgi:SWI/SNF-related matrix-associated actin-dependent regulator 1 of chromatin subfamily A